jgi:D-methionine transport system permease protein
MSPDILKLLAQSTGETLYMVAVAGLIGSLIGVPLGVFLATSGRGELYAAPAANKVLGAIVNATRSTPFIILVVAIIPFTRLVARTSIGTSAAIVPLTVATVPFVARLVEAAIREVDPVSSRRRGQWAPRLSRSSPRCCLPKRGPASRWR